MGFFFVFFLSSFSFNNLVDKTNHKQKNGTFFDREKIYCKISEEKKHRTYFYYGFFSLKDKRTDKLFF